MRTPLLSLLSLSAFTTVCQPTLNLGNMQPTVGDTYTRANAAYQAPGPAGVNVTWDFSTVVPVDAPLTLTYVVPSTAPGAANYPTANAAWQTASGFVNFQQYASTSLQDLGTWFGFGYGVFTDPIKVLAFPCTFNTTWNDNYQGTAQVFGTTIINGSITSTADAYGTLILPSGTFTNVLRVRSTRSETNITADLATTISGETYYFLKAGYSNPLMEIRNTTTTQPGGVPQVEQTLTYMTASSVGTPELAARIPVTVFPTATDGLVVIRTDSPLDGGTEVLLLDGLGRIVHRHVPVPAATLQLDLGTFRPGRYTVVVTWPDGRRSVAAVVRT